MKGLKQSPLGSKEEEIQQQVYCANQLDIRAFDFMYASKQNLRTPLIV